MINSAKEVNSKTRFTHTTSYCAGFFGEKVCVKRVFLWTIINMKPNKLVYGVGINDADYDVTKYEITDIGGKRKLKKVWTCPYYNTWAKMLERCYSSKLHQLKPTYKNCTASDAWLTFSNFKSWMEKQAWEGNQLDKDILFVGNKTYSADTCVFVTRMVNMFTIDRGAARGEWPIGTYWDKERAKFRARCSNPFTKKLENLGLFTCEQEAHNAWAKRKLELARLLADEQTDQRVAKALVDRYSQYCV